MNISFFLTAPQFLDGSKDITRRLGWKNLKNGDELTAILKGQGLKKGEKITILGKIVVVSHRWEPLEILTKDRDYGFSELVREGFPEMVPDQFVQFFCSTHKKCTPKTFVNRIEFKRIKP